MEAQVLQKDDLAVVCLTTNALHLLTNAVLLEIDFSLKQILEGRHNRPQGELVLAAAVRAAQVRHKNNRLGAVLQTEVDGWKRADNSFGVADLKDVSGIGLERHIKVDAH